jgi:hypothetical protein
MGKKEKLVWHTQDLVSCHSATSAADKAFESQNNKKTYITHLFQTGDTRGVQHGDDRMGFMVYIRKQFGGGICLHCFMWRIMYCSTGKSVPLIYNIHIGFLRQELTM